ncbi:DUF2062 domain-containing protein [Actibacterium pelagium]|uniref:DUF2062 domain-containing protein n=1 Tax=Actibacterium pelagium TaxID=2029103 RepID=A0A917AFK9_9RHOB|nr:DUF2062 domain-containing protein [Actibacterium pelagium]GGE49127.1 hypothetical protein GCM10011517_16220 [Actibacterium pelagium]
MVFKRRHKRSWLQIVADSLYPKGGWGRAALYIRHRLHRLPDTPHKIARGIGAGVFTTFTPFYTLHFFIAAILARMMKGNVLAALLATFFGNPLTYIPIGVISLKTGHFLLGTEFDEEVDKSLVDKFFGAASDFVTNLWALFTEAEADWSHLSLFYDEVFFPYMVGGVIPGIIAGVIAYYLSLPVITTYQKRRRAKLKKKLEQLRANAVAKPKD